jgi:DNA-binding NtrC family response regulator
MIALRDVVQRVAASDRPTLVSGPSGSGKSVVVQAIHRLRAAMKGGSVGAAERAPFVEVSCGIGSETELEVRLFGTIKVPGALATSAGGTLVLEDVEALPARLQAKIVRVIQGGLFCPLGAQLEERFRGRIIAVTHRALEKCVREHTFRADLLYELNVLAVTVPSLDERREDVPALVNHFLRLHQAGPRFTSEALDALASRTWPGNVRELKNLVDRAVTMVGEAAVDRDRVQQLLAAEPAVGNLDDSLQAIAGRLLEMPVGNKLAAMEAALLAEAMRATDGNKTAAGRLLGLHRKAVERKLARYRTRRGSSEAREAPAA